MAVTRTPPTQKELNEMLRTHLSFEINRFRLGAWAWQHQQPRGNGQAACLNAMVREAFLIHMRLILDFFQPRKKLNPKFRDVFVKDYLPGWSKTEPAWVETYRAKLDKQLAHLTLDRVRRPPWADHEINHLKALIDDFLAELPPARRALYDPKNGLEGLETIPWDTLRSAGT